MRLVVVWLAVLVGVMSVQSVGGGGGEGGGGFSLTNTHEK